MERGRTVILSDLHLGRPKLSARSAAALRPLWAGADHLVINGDTAEVHHPTWWSEAAREVLALHDLTEADGVELTLLSGNHDAYLTDHRHLMLGNDSILITHGDVLHPAVAPWSIRADRMRTAHEQAMQGFDEDGEERHTLESRLSASQIAGHAEWTDLNEQALHSSAWRMLARPWAIAQVALYWHRIPTLAARFAFEHAPAARFIVLGHTHRPGIWTRQQRTIINTGCYGFPGRPFGVVIEDHSLRVFAIKRDGDVWRFAPQARASFALPAAEATPSTRDHCQASHDEAA